jgi:5-methylcytosine-specific restriction endonuclease McrA
MGKDVRPTPPTSRQTRRQKRAVSSAPARARDAWCADCGAWPTEDCAGKHLLTDTYGFHSRRWDLARWCETGEHAKAFSAQLIEAYMVPRDVEKYWRPTQKRQRLEGRAPAGLAKRSGFRETTPVCAPPSEILRVCIDRRRSHY